MSLEGRFACELPIRQGALSSGHALPKVRGLQCACVAIAQPSQECSLPDPCRPRDWLTIRKFSVTWLAYIDFTWTLTCFWRALYGKLSAPFKFSWAAQVVFQHSVPITGIYGRWYDQESADKATVWHRLSPSCVDSDGIQEEASHYLSNAVLERIAPFPRSFLLSLQVCHSTFDSRRSLDSVRGGSVQARQEKALMYAGGDRKLRDQ